MSPIPNHQPLKDVLKQFEVDLIDQVVNFNGEKVRKIAPIEDKEVQAADRRFNYNESPTQADLSAINVVQPQPMPFEQAVVDGLEDRRESSQFIGVVENSNILPLSLNESRNDAMESNPLSRDSKQTSTQKLKHEMDLQDAEAMKNSLMYL